ncbi:MAG: M20/M25/M40 family metallo-hydrolase, partial [Gammaproteobacteria bacterium]
TLNLGQIHGGDNPNRICPFCQLKFDLRFLPDMAAQALRAEFRAFVEERLANDGFKIEWEALFDGIPAFQTGAESELVRFAESLTGHGAQAVAFGTEAPYFSELGIETIVLGPGEVTTAHQPNENLRIDRIQPTVDQLRQMIDRFCLA